MTYEKFLKMVENNNTICIAYPTGFGRTKKGKIWGKRTFDNWKKKKSREVKKGLQVIDTLKASVANAEHEERMLEVFNFIMMDDMNETQHYMSEWRRLKERYGKD